MANQMLTITISLLQLSVAFAHDGSDQKPVPTSPPDAPQWIGCLPGPLKHKDHVSCTSFVADDDGYDTVLVGSSQWAPWSHRPYCVDGSDKKEYCVFTNTSFPRPGQGISIITTPERALSIAKAFNYPAHPASLDNDPPYEIREIPGKGKGVVATRRIPKGTNLMVDYAALLADESFMLKVKRAEGRRLMTRSVIRLANNKKEVLGLARSRTDMDLGENWEKMAGVEEVIKRADQEVLGAVIEDIYKTNSFSMGGDDFTVAAVFPRISRINHACKPNAYTFFTRRRLIKTIVSQRDIQPGEEITISCKLPNPLFLRP